jgi:hypothetical protein
MGEIEIPQRALAAASTITLMAMGVARDTIISTILKSKRINTTKKRSITQKRP